MPKLLSCHPRTSILKASRMMKRENTSAMIVAHEEKPVGLITDHILAFQGLAENRDPHSPVEDIMLKQFGSLKLDYRLSELLDQMKVSESRWIVVLDDLGRAVGILSTVDVFQLLADELSDLASGVAVLETIKKDLAA